MYDEFSESFIQADDSELEADGFGDEPSEEDLEEGGALPDPETEDADSEV